MSSVVKRTTKYTAPLLLLIALFAHHATAEEIRATDSCNRLYAALLGPTNAEFDKVVANNGNLFAIPERAPEETKKLNAAVFDKLHSEKAPRIINSRRKTGLTIKELNKLYKTSLSNKQIKESLCGSYRGSPNYGFCWGRAMAVHLKALQTNINNKSVRKLWAVGSMDDGHTQWRYHVTTIVRADDGAWYAIDPIFHKPMLIEDWLATMKKRFDPRDTLRVFVTPAKRFGPEKWAKYDKKVLNDAFYYDFFSDFMNEIYKENTKKAGLWKDLKANDNPSMRAAEIQKLLKIAGAVGAASSPALYYFFTRDSDREPATLP